jgi:ribulose kinase
MGEAVRGAVESLSQAADTTCCSVVVLDTDRMPLRGSRCILWMDGRSAPQTKEMLDSCRGDPSLMLNCGGEGPISAEWFIPKSLWIPQNEPKVWEEEAETICEYQDYINDGTLRLFLQCSHSMALGRRRVLETKYRRQSISRTR